MVVLVTRWVLGELFIDEMVSEVLQKALVRVGRVSFLAAIMVTQGSWN